MAKLDIVVARCKSSSVPIDKLCNIKTYLSTNDKFEFLKKYDELVKEHSNDYHGYEEFVELIFFNLLIVKKYTDIELELTYEEFDKLQSCGIIGLIASQIGADYELMMQLVKMKKIN